MSVAERLSAFTRGDADTLRTVLQNCRTAAFGTAAFGREDSAALFRAMPLDLDVSGAVVTPELVALFGSDGRGRDAALFADVHGEEVMRLWALGSARHGADPVDETAVPFDADLDQRGGRFRFEADDHPALAPDGADALRALGQGWMDEQPRELVGPLERVRPVLLRAGTAGGRTAGLLMLQGLAATGGVARFAAGVLTATDTRIVVDAAGREAELARRRVVRLREGEPAGAEPPA